MKHGSLALIQNYKKSNSKIIITFFSGKTIEIDLSEENEKNLLNYMIEQAENRNNSSQLERAKRKRSNALLWIISESILAAANIFNFATTNSNFTRILAGIASGFTSIAVIVNGFNYKVSNEEIQELKKYDIFLSIRHKLENITDNSIFSGVKIKDEELNINTLDNYSLKDLKKIRDNLKKSEEHLLKFDSSGGFSKKMNK